MAAKVSPMPTEWLDGVPQKAITAFTHGRCPVHRVQLITSGVRVPDGTAKEAGWCASCEAWWHRPYRGNIESGLAVTYYRTAG